MAQKKITDLTLRSNFDATCNLPVDDTSQTWRATGQQLLDFIKSQNLSARYSLSNTVTPGGSVDTLITYNVKEFDTGISNQVVAGVFTASVGGIFSVSATASFANAAGAPGGVTSNMYLKIYKNGTFLRRGPSWINNANVDSVGITTLVQLAQGDTFDIRVYQDFFGGGTALDVSDPAFNELCIFKI